MVADGFPEVPIQRGQGPMTIKRPSSEPMMQQSRQPTAKLEDYADGTTSIINKQKKFIFFAEV